jgi:hypothetical protein
MNNILVLSNENIRGNEYNIMGKIIKEYDHEIIVITMGENGLLLYAKEKPK